MRTPTIGTLTLFGLAAALVTAPVTLADTSTPDPVTTTDPTSSYPPPSPEIYISGDGRPQPGDEISVVIRCPFTPRDPSSPVLEIGELQQVESPAGIDTYVAPATIDPAAEPGDYPVTSWCGKASGSELEWIFRVYPADSGSDDATAPAEPSTAEPVTGRPSAESGQVATIPKGAPETGGGPVSGAAR